MSFDTKVKVVASTASNVTDRRNMMRSLRLSLSNLVIKRTAARGTISRRSVESPTASGTVVRHSRCPSVATAVSPSLLVCKKIPFK